MQLEIRTIRKNQQDIQQIKTSATDVKNAFHDLISTLDKTEERVSEHEDRQMETSPTDAQENGLKKN